MHIRSFHVVLAGLLIFAACLTSCNDTTEPKNQNPGVPEISPTGFVIAPGDTISLTAEAADPDGDALTYSWTFAAGEPTTAVGETVTWTAPSTNTSVILSVQVSDGRGGGATVADTIGVDDHADFDYALPFEGTMDAEMDLLSEDGIISENPEFCHFSASVAVLWMNTAVVVFTGLPTMAFLEAATHRPVWFPPDTWLWAYTVPWAGGLATVEVYGTLASSGIAVDWEMLVSGTLQDFDHFQWVTGTSQIDGTAGDWTLYDSRVPDTATEALQIDWTRQAQDDRSILYRNVLVGSASVGDSLQYSVLADSAQVRLVDVSEGTTKSIEWNLDDGSGTFVGSSGECCWGPAPTYPDVDCE